MQARAGIDALMMNFMPGRRKSPRIVSGRTAGFARFDRATYKGAGKKPTELLLQKLGKLAQLVRV